ncbi:MAG: SDR family oxidoreductase [Defluviitaleaceae bacterium]|nr:SDR family oxidoreductase [Defluviitaleaceae bacterium]
MIILITGGTSGIGLATAKLLLSQGHKVIVTGQNSIRIERAKKELSENALVLQANTGSLEDTKQLTQQIKAEFGKLDGIFLNAGLSKVIPLATVRESDWDMLFNVNTKGQFFTLQSLLPLLTEGGSVVFTVGVGVKKGVEGGSLVSGSRGALLGMIPSLAVELAPRKIRVNAISPGVVDTPVWSKLGLPDDVIKDMFDQQAKSIPLARVAHAEDIAQTAAFLLSDASSYITGQNIAVAGGMDVV